MKRGNIVTVIIPGAYGKPRPAVVFQSDLFDELPSVTLLPITSHLCDAPLLRITINPDSENGLLKKSQVMIDKIQTVPREKVDKVIGSLSEKKCQEITRSLIMFLGIK